jgi:hypothetical protein
MDFFKPLYDALSSPVWGSLSVISAIVLAIVTWIQVRLKEKKVISYSILTDTLVIRVKEDVEKDVKILFKDKPVKNVRLVELKIWNSGNVPIRKQDYEKPLSFLPTFVEHSNKLLYVSDIEKTPENLPMEPVYYEEEDVIGLSKTLFNKGDSITIKMLLAGYDEKISVIGRIAGVNRIEEAKRNNASLPLMSKVIFFIIGGLFGIIMFFILIYALGLLNVRDRAPAMITFWLGFVVGTGLYSPTSLDIILMKILPKKFRDRLYGT